MRLAYGVFGYGRGHATRALGVLPELCARHEVLIFASGDAYEMLAPLYDDVIETPRMTYTYRLNGQRCFWRTGRDNASSMADALFLGPAMREVLSHLRSFKPDVVVGDCEPFTHHGAALLGLPRISFDHFGVMVHCRPDFESRDRLRAERDAVAYRLVVGFPRAAVVSSFYNARPAREAVQVVPTVLRDEVLSVTPTSGEHILVYLNNGRHQLTARIEDAFHRLRRPVVVYGAGRRGTDGDVVYKAPSNHGFLEDLARCEALLSTAGNQLVGEAMYLGKPMLAVPENTVEQRLNAAWVERLAIGRKVEHADLTVRGIEEFLRDAPRYATRARQLSRDGRSEAVAALERYIRGVELAPWAHRGIAWASFVDA
ncbi:MAG: glycosyltransferase family protein [Myxococcota bacterium]